MEKHANEIDAVIEKMQGILQAMREQDPDFYAKYPMQLITEAEEQAIQSVSEKWRLPADYLYFLKQYVPESVSWNTDKYINLDIYGAKDLLEGQCGYNYNPVTDEVITEWPSDYLVIASDEGDPYCIDLSREDTVIYTAEHGTGSWDFSVAYDNLVEFLHSVLQPRGGEELEFDEVEYDYYNIFLTGAGSDKIKTLLFIKKMFSCDYSQAKAYLDAVPLLIFKGIDQGAARIEDELKGIGAEYERRQISFGEFIAQSVKR
ncbi:SMI1/KNR4 family protein [Brevibacillus reuszeri]|uniref:SMI1/KNR4 family protein n=1 Tax=Brevibacillus reuszeri TaxID=54915 RepID=UPI0028974BCF|nr:SMI1/KNR4 family protein [Brevibacillus reuszeri]